MDQVSLNLIPHSWGEALFQRVVAVMVTSAIGFFAASGAPSAAEERAAALDNAIPLALERGSIPGAIVGIWQEGREPYVRAFGVSDRATGKPMTTDMYMRIGSTTKSFVATAILMLADRGKLSLDDTIEKYIQGVPNGDKNTLRQLAAMRSGLFNYAEETNPKMPKEPFRQWTPRELVEVSFAHPPLFSPGSAFDYSNTNTVLLGLVVEAVSGQSLKSFVEENILKPAGMSRTVFPVGAEIPSPHAHGYLTLPDGKIVDATEWNPSWGWAAGNMISTLEDMRVWARVLATGQLISPAMKAERDRFLSAPGEGEGALYGLAIEYQNGWVGHNGNILSYMAYPYYLPADGITMVVLLNTGANIPASWKMMQDIAGIVSPKNPWTNLPKQ
jgi:D-alanyl-D-alanine carboxypeptidase